MISGKTFGEILPGEMSQFDVVVTAELVNAFASLSGDFNPLHTDKTYASSTPFGEPVAHGMIAGALFSRLVGVYLPGRYCLYLSQTLQFKKPIRIGASVTVEGVVVQKTEATRTLTLSTVLRGKADGEILVEGRALVRLLK